MIGISLTPLPAAVTQLTERKAFPSGMTSRDWESEPAAIRDRLFFSARVEEERILAAMHERLQVRIALAKSNGATMDKSRFIAEMQQLLREEGYKRPEGVVKGSLRDLKGYRRLSLIWDMNLAQAEGYARWKADMTKDGLANEPCWELIRVMDRVEIREWQQIWEDHDGGFYGAPGVDYPRALGRMIAPKTSPIWTRISRFNSPWPPFDWGSGMGLRGVDIDEAEELGVVKSGDKFTPLAIPFNKGVKASATNIDERGMESLRSDFGDHIRIDNDQIKLTTSKSNESISTDLLNRAREIAARGRDAFDGLRREDEIDLPNDFDPREIFASTSAVAVGRKLLYHEEWGVYSDLFARLIRNFLPDNVTVAVRDGHLYAFRKDLINLSLAEIDEKSVASTNGRLLGYGADMFEVAGVQVEFKIKGKVVGGFYAPEKNAFIFMKARRRDFTDALGEDVQVFINRKEVAP